MAGHGSPLRTVALLRPAGLSKWPALAALLLVFLSGQIAAQEIDMRVRVAWGGGPARSWQGSIRVSEGTISDVVPLGLEPDSPGAIQLMEDGTLAVLPCFPRGYDGVDVHITAPSDASLMVELQAGGDQPQAPIEWPLATVAKVVQQGLLDDQGSRVVAQRAPGDRLPVSMSRDSLVFAPGERFDFTVMPRQVDLSPNTSYLLNVALQGARGEAELTSQDREFRTDAAAIPQLEGIFALTLPVEEGVYDIRIALYPKRLSSSLVRGKPLFERRMQLVLIDPAQKPVPDQTVWQTALELDPAQPRWWERMIRLPSISRIPGFSQQNYGNGRPGIREHLGRSLIELAPEMWQAYPLAIADVGRLHVLEVEYPSDLAQSVQVSLIEPNAAGQVAPVGLDSGWEVLPPLPGNAASMRWQQIPFWPQSKSPLVLIVNRSEAAPALYGKIRVQVGPAQLPPLQVPSGSEPQRMLALALDRPYFCENLGAGEALDVPTGFTRKDWATFYQGASRLIEYLEYSGRNAAFITLASEGSALYPSPLLAPTPKYDTGIYFESGQDPLRKDVAELLFRLFDRAGLQLIPTVKFSSPLPEVESLLLDPENALGLLPVGPDGQTWMARHGGRRGSGMRYNPLDPRVRQAMRRVVAEIAERYGHHASFGGVAIHLAPDSYAIVPDDTYSLDDQTMARFSEETKTVVPGSGVQRYQQRALYLRRQGNAAWLDWRAGQIATLYQQMEADIARTHAGAKLYLHTGELLAAQPLIDGLRPTLPQSNRVAETLLKVGLDPPRLVGQGTMVILQPQRLVPSILPGRELQSHLNHWPDLATTLSGGGETILCSHPAAELRLPSFEELGPFGPEKTQTWFIPPLLPADAYSRQRLVHNLAVFDSQGLVDGGWLLPLGQDAPLRGVAAVYRRLPAERFKSAEPRNPDDRTQPVVIRTLVRDNKTYFYAVNDSPWPVTLNVEFESPEIFRVVSYHPDKPGTLVRQASRGTWTIDLDPFDLVGGELSSAQVRINTWRVVLPGEAETFLRQQVHETRMRAAALRTPLPLDVLSNPSFEAGSEMAGVSGWTSAIGPGVEVKIDTSAARTGAASLHLASRPVIAQRAPNVWIRSAIFAPPATGRVTLAAWFKVNDPARQPKLRLAIEGTLDGKGFYRRENIGAPEDGTPPRPLDTKWTLYRFHLPVHGLSNLKVGFDLMGEGEVWIDDVQVHDLWMEDAEQGELLKAIANANFQLSSGHFGDVYSFVQSYWPRFLEAHVPLPDAVLANGGELFAPPAAQPRAADARRERRKEKEAEPMEEKPGMLERMRNWWSKPILR